MSVKPFRRRLAVDMLELEAAFQNRDWELTCFLDTKAGAVAMVSAETYSQLEDLYDQVGEDIGAHVAGLDLPDWMKDALLEADEVMGGEGTRFIAVTPDEQLTTYGDLQDFIATVADPVLADRLSDAIEGRGAFGRFHRVLSSHRPEERRWTLFERERGQSRIVEWLHSIGIEPTFNPLPAPPPEPPPRPLLLAEAADFVAAARRIRGVLSIALIGSLASDKEWPNDVDLLVTVSEDADLAPLAKAARRLAGHTQSQGLGADVFLADASGRYLGRTCPWARCGPGYRISCDALTCGDRQYLHDDLRTIRLPDELVRQPPIELWPTVVTRTDAPDDVTSLLLRPRRVEPA